MRITIILILAKLVFIVIAGFRPCQRRSGVRTWWFKECEPHEYGHNQVRGVKSLGEDAETYKLGKHAEPDTANARSLLRVAPEVDDSRSPIPNVVFKSGG